MTACNCRETVLAYFNDRGIDAEVGVIAPIAPAYDPLAMRCPHGVVWYAQPTPEQIEAWTQVGVE